MPSKVDRIASAVFDTRSRNFETATEIWVGEEGSRLSSPRVIPIQILRHVWRWIIDISSKNGKKYTKRVKFS